ncbi:hypothetical protein Bbelb_293720 [Branchiostoma belcheri]|nr:hypothetical protein Bbelb_293720 [Branchiostoma belcheri]
MKFVVVAAVLSIAILVSDRADSDKLYRAAAFFKFVLPFKEHVPLAQSIIVVISDSDCPVCEGRLQAFASARTPNKPESEGDTGGIAKRAAGGSCQDRQHRCTCNYYKYQGFCDTARAYMQDQCAATCGFCTVYPGSQTRKGAAGGEITRTQASDSPSPIHALATIRCATIASCAGLGAGSGNRCEDEDATLCQTYMSRGYLTNPQFQYTVTCNCPKSAGVCVGGDDGDTGQSEEASEEEVDAGDFKDGCLGAHNTHRADHSARPLTWCEKCAEFAQRHCDTLAARGDGRMTHSTRRSRIWDGKPHGENLAYMTGATCPMVVDYWYDEKDNYIRYKWNPVRNFRHGDFGHFTQEVWKSTTGVGCGQTGNYVCCVYEPSGNKLTSWQFHRNVET